MYLYATLLVVLVCKVDHITSTNTHDDRNPGLMFDNHPGYLLSLPANMTKVKQMTTKVSCKMDCVFACVETPWCRSVNFKIIAEMDGRHICELIATDNFTNPKYLKQDEKFTHLNIQNPCEGKPCLNKGKCLLHENRRDYRCRCKKGYTGEKCQHDIDECTTASPCHVKATCINIPGSYACRCNDGFSGDGFSCADIDECATNTHQCDKHAYCNNTEGSYRCTCNRGYHGNGIKCTTSRGLDMSAILSNYGNADYIRTLSGYLDPVLQSSSRSRWIRCWHAATDGWNTATIFHPQCDGKGPTVTIVRVGSYVFGGYTDVSWHSRWQHFSSSRSFLYSLYNTNGYSPVKLTLNGRDGNQHAIYGGSSYGPTFGRGHDLVISNYASNTTSSHTYMGFSYYAPPGCRNGGYECSTLAGTYGFTPNDIEVFYETTS